MAEKIGFITNMKPEWMDLAYRCKIDGLSKGVAKPLIEENLSITYKSQENILKTRRILETVFYDSPSWILEDSMSDYRALSDDQKLPLFWALLISRFPIFYDTCRSIGTITEYRDIVTITQARQPVYEKWGTRNIVQQSVKKVFQTLKDLVVVKATEKPGSFTVIRHTISDARLVNYLIVSILEASKNTYMTWESLVENRVLFPFSIKHVTQADAASCKNLSLERMGDEIVIRLKE